jgi:hypothetical protein
MAAKSAHEAAKAKAAKEKKILIALAVPLAAALFFAYHTVTKLHQPAAPVVVAPAATPATVTNASSTTPTATVATGSPISATLPVAPAPPADAGKLTRMTLLASKDPFFDAGPQIASGSSAPAKQTKQPKQPKQKPVPPADAVIGVNGRLAVVSVGQDFPVTNDPATNGVFRLVGLTAKAAKVAVAGGSYTTGAHALKLTVNSVVTLMNTADGKRYTLVLYPPGTPAPGLNATTTPATATTTTTGP